MTCGAHNMGVMVPWAHVHEKTRQAFREVLNFAAEETACQDCGSDLCCPVCNSDEDSEICCHYCGSELVCPSCEVWVEPSVGPTTPAPVEPCPDARKKSRA